MNGLEINAIRDKVYKQSVKENTFAVLGLQLGDEGKGRIIDNVLKRVTSDKNVEEVYLVRPQGGNNAGHTVEKDGVKIGLHQLPSGIFYDNVFEVLDAGMIINAEDLITEIALAEKIAPGLKKRVILSEDAMLCTDIQRAKEVLNRILNDNSKGGTGRGIGPTTAEFYDKTGQSVKDLLLPEWGEIFSEKYTVANKYFASQGQKLSTTNVPDFEKTKLAGKTVIREVGSQKVFLQRLEEARAQILKLKIVRDTYYLHQEISDNPKKSICFELAQAVGLDPWLGTRPDRTTTPTTAFAILYGTRFWQKENVEEIIGVLKATYMSSVGARTMPTQTSDEWATWVRETAHEYGTTTGRPRDICYIDLPFILYNIKVSGATSLGITHLDISKKEYPIKVCTHYTYQGKVITYKPDMSMFDKFKPNFIDLPSWDIREVEGKTNFNDLPQSAKNYIRFLEEVTGLPVSIITTGSDRKHFIDLS